MKFNRNSIQRLQRITLLGRKVIKQIGLLILFGILFKYIDEFQLKKQCLIKQEPAWECSVAPFIGDLGSNLFQVAITILAIDFGLKREALEEMEKIFKSVQPNSHIQAFYPKRKDYNHLVETSFKEAKLGQVIKLLCLSTGEAVFLIQENLNEIREKVKSGCHIKILLLHPESSLLKCIESVGFLPQLHNSNLISLSHKLKRLCSELEDFKKDEILKGTIEIQLHKNLFSPIGYYSDSKEVRIIWMYFSDFHNGNEYPAFQTSKQELIDDTEKHFENLWRKTKNDHSSLLIKITKDEQIDNIDKILP